jgi:hypothetical protein
MRGKLWVALAVPAVALAACYSLDDVRQGPVVWTATYQAQFDTMTNCLAGLYSGEFSVVPQVYQREQRANVVLAFPQGGAVMGEFQLRQVDPSRTEVSWRFIGARAGSTVGVNRLSRERADRCGRGG